MHKVSLNEFFFPTIFHFLSLPSWRLSCYICLKQSLTQHVILQTSQVAPAPANRLGPNKPVSKTFLCNEANNVHIFCKGPTWGDPRGKQKVSMLKITVGFAALWHISHPVTRLILIDVTISNVAASVNHTDIWAHWLSFTQDASVFSWGELWKVRQSLINTSWNWAPHVGNRLLT